MRPVVPSPEERAADAVRGALVRAGWQEALTLPFVAPGLPDDASPWCRRPAIRVGNPTRAEEPLLRRSLLGPLLRCLERNRSRGVEGARLFEIGVAFLPAEGGGRPEERRLVSGMAEADFAGARGAVESVAESLGIGGRLAWEPAGPADPVQPLDPARTARILLDGKVAGYVGEVHAGAGGAEDLRRLNARAAAFELDGSLLLRSASLDREARAVSPHPESRRDLAFVLPAGVPWASLASCAREAGGPLLRAVELFDEYRGSGLPTGTRSLAFRLTFGAPDRTLRGGEIDAAVAAVVSAVEGTLGGRLRGQEGGTAGGSTVGAR